MIEQHTPNECRFHVMSSVTSGCLEKRSLFKDVNKIHLSTSLNSDLRSNTSHGPKPNPNIRGGENVRRVNVATKRPACVEDPAQGVDC
jgi:hypothetical protein